MFYRVFIHVVLLRATNNNNNNIALPFVCNFRVLDDHLAKRAYTRSRARTHKLFDGLKRHASNACAPPPCVVRVRRNYVTCRRPPAATARPLKIVFGFFFFFIAFSRNRNNNFKISENEIGTTTRDARQNNNGRSRENVDVYFWYRVAVFAILFFLPPTGILRTPGVCSVVFDFVHSSALRVRINCTGGQFRRRRY